MKLPIPHVTSVKPQAEWDKILSELEKEKSDSLLILNKKQVTGTVVCKPTLDRLLLNISRSHKISELDGKLMHCFELGPEVAKEIFDKHMNLFEARNSGI